MTTAGKRYAAIVDAPHSSQTGETASAIRGMLNKDGIEAAIADSAYGAEHIQMLDRQMDASIIEFERPSFSEVATSLGGQGEPLEAATEAINSRKGPIVVDPKLDPNQVPRMRM